MSGKPRPAWVPRIGSEDGSITIEAVLWLPLYLMFFALVADVSLLFHAQAKATRIAQDINRLAVIGYLENESEMKDRADAQIQAFSPSGFAQVTMASHAVSTTVTMPTNDLVAVGWFSALTGENIVVQAVHLMEV